MHHPVEQDGAFGDGAGFPDPQAQDQRPVVERGACRDLVMETAQQIADRAGNRRDGQRALGDRSPLAQMAMHDKPALDRIHRTVDPLDRVRQAVVEHQQAIEARLDGLVKPAPGLLLREVGAKRIALALHQRLAADRAAQIPSQRIDEAEPPVQ